jgi:hypothetical protein
MHQLFHQYKPRVAGDAPHLATAARAAHDLHHDGKLDWRVLQQVSNIDV